MTRTLLIFAFLLLAAPASAGDSSALHQRLVVIDPHVDVPVDLMAPVNDPGGQSALQFDFNRLAAGGVDAMGLALFTPLEPDGPDAVANARAMMHAKLAGIEAMLAAYPDRIALARTPEDLTTIIASNRHAVILTIENGAFLGDDVSAIGDWVDRGIAAMAFTHAGHNQLADSSRPKTAWGQAPDSHHGGLSDAGRQLVGLLNDAGVIVDVSQVSTKAAMEMVALSRAPVIASHSAARALVDHPRNLTDDEIRAIAAKGGVVHVVGFDIYLKTPSAAKIEAYTTLSKDFGLARFADAMKLPPERLAAFEAARAQIEVENPPASVADLANHIEHVIRLVGVDHVGVGSDFNHGGLLVGWADVGETGAITAELAARGYQEADLAKIMGGNFLRVWRAAQTEGKPQ